MQITLIDNYDSFTFNLYQQISRLGQPWGIKVNVVRNDASSASALLKEAPAAFVFSPGPGGPRDSGICREILARGLGQVPILGICLGHQLIAEFFGAKVVRAQIPIHGKTSLVHHRNSGLFTGLSSPLSCMRYHSLVVASNPIPDCLMIDAVSETREIMALHHRKHPLWGIQFHPESFLTEQGDYLISAFLKESKQRFDEAQVNQAYQN